MKILDRCQNSKIQVDYTAAFPSFALHIFRHKVLYNAKRCTLSAVALSSYKPQHEMLDVFFFVVILHEDHELCVFT